MEVASVWRTEGRGPHKGMRGTQRRKNKTRVGGDAPANAEGGGDRAKGSATAGVGGRGQEGWFVFRVAGDNSCGGRTKEGCGDWGLDSCGGANGGPRCAPFACCCQRGIKALSVRSDLCGPFGTWGVIPRRWCPTPFCRHVPSDRSHFVSPASAVCTKLQHTLQINPRHLLFTCDSQLVLWP